jgi:hypothetical protein
VGPLSLGHICARHGRSQTAVYRPGKGAGKSSIQHYLSKYGITLDKDAVNDLTQEVKTVGRIRKGNLTEEGFLIMVEKIQKGSLAGKKR